MDRFNYTQSFGDLGACSDLESLKTVLSSVIEALEKNGISPPPVNANTAAQQDADGNWKYPSSEPPRPWFRFKLTDVFSDGVAPAVVIDSATSELTPGEQVAVTDVLGFYSSGAADDLGYAMVAESTIPGKMQNEVWIMPGVGVPTGTDNYTVKLEDSGDDAEYMEAKFEHLDGATYDAGTHQFVYSTVVGSGTSRQLRLFTAIGAGGADTDKLVACSPDDTAGYLEGKLANVTAEEYNSTIHMLVKWYTDNEGSGDEQMVAVVDRDDETGLTRVAEGDSLDYLGDQFGYTGTEPGSGATPVYVDATNGTTCDTFITWRDTGTYDSTTHALVYEQNASDGGFTKARLFTPIKRTWWGVVTVEISALTGYISGSLTPGSGTVQIYGSDGTLTMGVTKTFKNWMNSAVEVGTTVIGDEEPNGDIWVRVAPCDPLEEAP